MACRCDICVQVQGRRPESLKARLWQGFSRLLDGFTTIRASRYLSRLTLYIILNATISSMMYFEKSMVRQSCLPFPYQQTTVLNFCTLPGVCIIRLPASSRMIANIAGPYCSGASGCLCRMHRSGFPVMVSVADGIWKDATWCNCA